MFRRIRKWLLARAINKLIARLIQIGEAPEHEDERTKIGIALFEKAGQLKDLES